MIEGKEAIRLFENAGVRLFTGVPDSLMKGFCRSLDDHEGPSGHVPAPNEGAAVAIAAGHYMATGAPAVVYMQNSGLGNAMNPLGSLASKRVYGIPMILLVGWRGEPGVQDEPQHAHQGAITRSQLEALDIPTDVIGPEDDFGEAVAKTIRRVEAASGPVAMLIQKGTFSSPTETEDGRGFKRIDAIRAALTALPSETVYVATTGYTGRELALVRDERGEDWRSDFLMVGSMGHASAISLGIARSVPERPVCCLDGDGAVAMHMGSLAAVGRERPQNLVHIVLNNGTHESVGGQPSVVGHVDIASLASALGYTTGVMVADAETLRAELERFADRRQGPVMIDARIAQGTKPGLPRPSDFADRLRDLTGWLTDE